MKTNLISALLMGMTFSACVVSQDAIVPSENYITQKVKVEAFDGISTSTAIDVVYTQADQTDIEIYAPDNLMPFVKLVNDGGMLKVFFESDEPGNGINIRGKHHTKVNISAPAVHALHTSSSGDIVLVNGLKTNGLVTVESSSAGDIELKNVACSTLQVEASSAGDVTLSGTCRMAKLEASSAGEIDADDLKADTVKAEASSSGDVSCYAVESLEASTSSAGNVHYKGNPKHIHNHSKGVKKID